MNYIYIYDSDYGRFELWYKEEYILICKKQNNKKSRYFTHLTRSNY